MVLFRKIPKFKYNENPVLNEIFIKNPSKCPVCGLRTTYVYQGPFYSTEEVEDICPWCIADGSAAAIFDGTFQDGLSCEKVDRGEYTDELIHRTPGYSGWQQEAWLSHCGDYCAFVGYVGWNEIVNMGLLSELNDDFERFGLTKDSEKQSLVKGGSPQGYLFKCIICGKHRVAIDFD